MKNEIYDINTISQIVIDGMNSIVVINQEARNLVEVKLLEEIF
jgi:hypothetical protein